MKYRSLKLGEIKLKGDQIKGEDEKTWRDVVSEVGSVVSAFDLSWGKYRRPIKDLKDLVAPKSATVPTKAPKSAADTKAPLIKVVVATTKVVAPKTMPTKKSATSKINAPKKMDVISQMRKVLSTHTSREYKISEIKKIVQDL